MLACLVEYHLLSYIIDYQLVIHSLSILNLTAILWYHTDRHVPKYYTGESSKANMAMWYVTVIIKRSVLKSQT